MADHDPAGCPTDRRRYRRIAPVYDLLELPFEAFRYRPLRRMLFAGLSGNILEAGIGTGRNMPFYPPGATVTGLDASPEMLVRARERAARLGLAVTLIEADVRDTGLPDRSFDAVVASFLFCVLSEDDQVPALEELARLLKPTGELRLLEYTRPKKPLRRVLTQIWEPWIRWAYGASFDRDVERLLPAVGLKTAEARFVVDELIRFTIARPAG